jgi:hypothetical protein
VENADYALALAMRRYFGARLSDQYRDHYHLIASVFNGVVLGAAAATLLLIVRSAVPGRPMSAALALWLGSFGSLICNYNGPMVNSILIVRPPNFVDIVTPFAIGVLGFALFALSVPLPPVAGRAPSQAAQLDHLTWWFLAAAADWAFVAAHILNTRAHLRLSLLETPADLVPLIAWCESILRRAIVGTVAMAVTLTVVFLLLRVGAPAVVGLRWLPPPRTLRTWQGLMALVYGAGMVGLVVIQEEARRVMTQSVSAKPIIPPGEAA